MKRQLLLATLMVLLCSTHSMHFKFLDGCQCRGFRKPINPEQIKSYSIIPNCKQVQVILHGEKDPICLDEHKPVAKRLLGCTLRYKKHRSCEEICLCLLKNRSSKRCQIKQPKGYHLSLRSLDK